MFTLDIIFCKLMFIKFYRFFLHTINIFIYSEHNFLPDNFVDPFLFHQVLLWGVSWHSWSVLLWWRRLLAAGGMRLLAGLLMAGYLRHPTSRHVTSLPRHLTSPPPVEGLLLLAAGWLRLLAAEGLRPLAAGRLRLLAMAGLLGGCGCSWRGYGCSSRHEQPKPRRILLVEKNQYLKICLLFDSKTPAKFVFTPDILQTNSIYTIFVC